MITLGLELEFEVKCQGCHLVASFEHIIRVLLAVARPTTDGHDASGRYQRGRSTPTEVLCLGSGCRYSQDQRLRVWSLESGLWGLGVNSWGFGFGFWGLGLGFRVKSSGFRV